MALSTPSVTKVNTDGYFFVGALWVTTATGLSPAGPPATQPPSPSFFSNDVRPMMTAPRSSTRPCSISVSRTVGFLKNQSCRVSAPLPNGFSRLSPGPVTNPSRDMDMSEMTLVIRVPSTQAARRRSHVRHRNATVPVTLAGLAGLGAGGRQAVYGGRGEDRLRGQAGHADQWCAFAEDRGAYVQAAGRHLVGLLGQCLRQSLPERGQRADLA